MELESAKVFAAALCVSAGAIGSGIGEAMIASRAMDGMARNPEASSEIFKNMIVAMALDESTAIYCLVTALIILFV